MPFDIFLDRDGTLIKDTGYISSIVDVEVMDGVFEGLKLFKSKNYRLHIISNQSGVPRGKILPQAFSDVEKHFYKVFFLQNIEFDSVSYCFHLPTENCECRKPKIGLFEKISNEYQIEKRASAMLGNSEVDKSAAQNFRIPFWKVEESGIDFYQTAREVVSYFGGN